MFKSNRRSPTIGVNEKYVKEFIIRNWTHFILASNSPHALHLVKEDRRWFIPKITEQKRDAKYWIGLNAWLIDGGLEIIHEWAHDYVTKYGAVNAGDDPPETAAKDVIIETSRSEGQQFVYDIAVSVSGGRMSCRLQPIVLTDRTVREWLAAARKMHAEGGGLNLNHPNLESLATIRPQLRDGGLTEIGACNVNRMKARVFANAAAIAAVKAAGAPDPGWKEYKRHWKKVVDEVAPVSVDPDDY